MFSMDQSTPQICSLMKTEFWIKSVTWDNAPPGGAACGAIFSLALLFKGFAVVALSIEELGPLPKDTFSLAKAEGWLLRAFRENKALRVKAEGRARSKRSEPQLLLGILL